MLTETGRVVAVESDSVWVETVRKSTCGSCSARSGCGHGLMYRLGDGRSCFVRVLPGDNEAPLSDCKVDDEVRIGIPEDLLLHGSFIVYIVPLLGLLAGAAVADALLPASADLGGAIGALAGLLLGVLAVRWHSFRHRDDRTMQPTLIEVISRDEALTWSE
ncbi:MAG: SoxR reducing system RseC family protein [Pseudomonadota bacterium]